LIKFTFSENYNPKKLCKILISFNKNCLLLFFPFFWIHVFIVLLDIRIIKIFQIIEIRINDLRFFNLNIIVLFFIFNLSNFSPQFGSYNFIINSFCNKFLQFVSFHLHWSYSQCEMIYVYLSFIICALNDYNLFFSILSLLLSPY